MDEEPKLHDRVEEIIRRGKAEGTRLAEVRKEIAELLDQEKAPDIIRRIYLPILDEVQEATQKATDLLSSLLKKNLKPGDVRSRMVKFFATEPGVECVKEHWLGHLGDRVTEIKASTAKWAAYHKMMAGLCVEGNSLEEIRLDMEAFMKSEEWSLVDRSQAHAQLVHDVERFRETIHELRAGQTKKKAWSNLFLWIVGIAIVIAILGKFSNKARGRIEAIKLLESEQRMNGHQVSGYKIKFRVTNVGEAGELTVKVILSCSEGEYSRTQKLRFAAGEDQGLEFLFNEPSQNATNVQSRVMVSPDEKGTSGIPD